MKFNYEGHSLKSGIYKITNTHTNRIYIGSAARFKTRWQDGHAKSLLSNKHKNRFIQADFIKCKSELGHDDFLEFHVLEIMERSTKEERKDAEQVWIDKYFDNGKQCYNLKKRATVSRLDIPSKNPEVTRQRHSKASKEMWQCQEYRIHQSEIQSQRTKELWHDPEYRKNHEDKIREFTQTEEYREKLRDSAKTRKPRNKEIYQTQEFKEKISSVSKTLWQDQDYKVKQSDSRKISWVNNPERKQKARERMTKTLAKTYTLCSPEGEIITFTNMSKFCLEQGGLQPSGLCNVAKGKWSAYKGWTRLV